MRKVQEALFINKKKTTKEINWEKVINLQTDFALDSIWGHFNSEIKRIMSKKKGKGF